MSKLPKMSGFIQEISGKYRTVAPLTKEEIISAARVLLLEKVNKGPLFASPEATHDYLSATYHNYEHEVFSCLFLNTKHRLIDHVEMFRGTVDGSSVYPREVVKEALRLNAAAVIFCHNHPSGSTEPSFADRDITTKLQKALDLVDVRSLDHFIVGSEVYSFSEHGLI